jgi:xylulokinase
MNTCCSKSKKNSITHSMSLLAIDIGSSQCKAVAFALSGAVLARSVCSYSPDFPQPGFAEMDPDKFWTAVCRTARDVAQALTNDPVQALCLSSHGETLIPMDAKGEPVGAAILNMDNRASREAKWCDETIGARRIFEITGLLAFAMYPVPKILWLRQHRPEVYSRAERFLGVTDFIHVKLALPPYIGYSLASRFLAFDVLADRWSDEILRATGLKEDQLPLPVPAGTIAGNLDPDSAAALGVPSGTPVIVGGHDQACGALGVGVIKSGRVSDSMGTYECLAAASDEPRLGERAFAARVNSYSHVVPGKFLTLAYFPSGIMVQWFDDLIDGRTTRGTTPTANEVEGIDCRADAAHRYSKLEAQCTTGPTGLLATPHLIGTCTPDFDTHARATIFGLAPDSGSGQIYQGILEGIACELAQVKALLVNVNSDFKDLYVTGGGTRSPLGLKLRAAITGCRLHVMQCDEAVCQGAAILAGVGSGAYTRISDAVDRVVQEKEIIEPDAHLTAAYAKQLKQYRRLGVALKTFRDETFSRPQEENR